MRERDVRERDVCVREMCVREMCDDERKGIQVNPTTKNQSSWRIPYKRELTRRREFGKGRF